jgi:2-dehydro-3-deoxygalactonokinase
LTVEPVIFGDWGGSRLRLWLRLDGEITASCKAPGLLVAKEEPARVLRAAIAELAASTQPSRIVLSGMAGAHGGLSEAGYVRCPGGLDEWVGAALRTAPGEFATTILPGFSSRTPDGRPDIMRGEEAQVFGVLALQELAAEERQDIVLPGTHSKWVSVEGGRIIRFATCPTGELHARLLGSSLAPDDARADGEEHEAGFAAGIGRARESEALLASLFEARAARLLDGHTGAWSRGFLSGLLIGSEIAAMTPRLAPDAPLWLVGSPGLTGLYRAALDRFGLACRTFDGETCALKGLEMADARLG